MREATTGSAAVADAGDDATLVARIVGGERTAFQQLMRLHNSALFRAARAIVRDDADAEDVLQEAYLSAYRHLPEFRGEARLSTWLTRIVINQALGRLRSRRRDNVVALLDDRAPGDAAPVEQAGDDAQGASPEAGAMRAQLRRLLERKIDALPLAFRTAFMLREVEEMTIDEVARCLAIPAATVRTRVFRARALLRASLAEEMDMATADVFSFAGARCDRIVAGVLDRLDALDAAPA
ncbi:MAG TPA: RNA polymerase sigma factor [Caldimonas sp.]|jgi:RNA polymerase sigma-70 factor (ECF subfamily)|nr:RNA polymerase sigma factor [Caldimonas sp.]HEV7578724.1 RNA polymerase sigma factor [Caldimonas sp.]